MEEQHQVSCIFGLREASKGVPRVQRTKLEMSNYGVQLFF
jgi:hypothetical protein